MVEPKVSSINSALKTQHEITIRNVALGYYEKDEIEKGIFARTFWGPSKPHKVNVKKTMLMMQLSFFDFILYVFFFLLILLICV